MITTESYKGIPVSIVGEAHSGGIWPAIISKIVNRWTLTEITDDSFHRLGEALRASFAQSACGCAKLAIDSFQADRAPDHVSAKQVPRGLTPLTMR
jgi:hypothetical protein